MYAFDAAGVEAHFVAEGRGQLCDTLLMIAVNRKAGV